MLLAGKESGGTVTPDPLSIVATVFGVVGTAVAVASRLWPSAPPAAPRETSLPPAPSQPSLHECAGCASLRAEVRAVQGDASSILLTLARMEGAAEERKQLRADQRARAKGTHEPRESNG